MNQDTFFDRKVYLNLLEKRIGNFKEGYRQNIALIGDELVGKTALIHRFLASFTDAKIIFLYLEVRPEPTRTFANRFMGVLLYNFLLNSGIPLKEDLDYLTEKAAAFIPKTANLIRELRASLEKRKKTNVFPDLFALCGSIHEESQKYCVVIFDEFQNLENTRIKNLYKDWSKILISQKSTMHIIISSMKFKAREILAKDLSLLFGNFEIVTIEPFNVKVSEAFLESKFSGQTVGFETKLKNFLVHFTGGYPFYLDLISEAALTSQSRDLADILEDLLFKPTGILNQRFSSYFKKFLESPHSLDYIAILNLISNGTNKIKDISHILHKPKDQLIIKISSLLECDCISRSGDFLEINDRVFSFWLKFVHLEKLHSLTFDATNQKTIFKEKINLMIRDFIFTSQKPLGERIQELLRLFSDDTIQLDEKKKLKLTHFREIKSLEFNRKHLKDGLIGRSSDAMWLIALKNESLNEDDIAEFAKECKKYRNKLERKIMITCNDVDSNARLRALEEKILTWDLNNVNHILDLYSKPRIFAHT